MGRRAHASVWGTVVGSSDRKKDVGRAALRRAASATLESLERRSLFSTVASWPFNEASGTTAADASGYGHFATLVGGASFTAGHSGNALTLGGSGAYADGGSAVINTTQSFTVRAWVKWNGTGSYNTILSQDGSQTSGFFLQRRGDNGKFSFVMQGADSVGASQSRVDSIAAPVANRWYNVAGVFDATGGQIRLYVDGRLQGSAAWSPSWSATGDTVIGAAKWGGARTDYFAGQIDDATVDDGALPAAMLAVPSSAAQWQFNETSGTTAADASGNGLSAQLTGGASFSAGRSGNALTLNGSTGLADAGSSVIDTGASYTASAWVKWDGSSGFRTFLSTNGTQTSAYFLQINGDTHKFSFVTQSADLVGAAQAHVDSLSLPVANQWYHVAGVYDATAGEIRLYVNGQLQGEAPFTSTWSAGGNTLIGAGKWKGARADFFSGQIDDASVQGGVLSAAQITAAAGLPATAVPSPFTAADIGSPTLPGATTYDPTTGTYAVSGSGSDIWNTSDQFQFVSQSLAGDGTIVAQVTSTTRVNGGEELAAKAGLMFRASNAANAPFVQLVVSGKLGLQMLFRDRAGDSAGQEGHTIDMDQPFWLMLVRHGDNFTGYYAKTASTPTAGDWIAYQSHVGRGMHASPALAGLVACSHDVATIGTATFDGVSVTAGLPTAVTPDVPQRVSADVLSGTGALVRWVDNSAVPASTYDVRASTDGGQTYTTVGTAAAGTTALLLRNLTPQTNYKFSVAATSNSGGATVTTAAAVSPAAVVTPMDAGSQQYTVRLNNGGNIVHGDADYNSSGTAELVDPNPNNPSVSEPVDADSPEEAMYAAVQLYADVSDTGAEYEFPDSGAFQVSASNGGDGMQIALEDSYETTDIDTDYNDDYWYFQVDPVIDPPQVEGDQVSATANQRVDVHGVPLPDPSPTGQGASESDRIPNSAAINAFDLTPSFSTTDVAVPLPGGELTEEFRRTEHIDSRVTDTQNPDNNVPWTTDNLLGVGWSTNITSRVMVSYDPHPQPTQPVYKATVYDEVGDAVGYASDGGGAFYPDVRSSFSNLALRGTLTTDVTYNGTTYNFCYTKTYGTKLYYSYIASTTRGSSSHHTTESYARLEKIVDRNGNEIDFAYDHPYSSLLPTAMYDPSLGDATTSPRKLTFGYEVLGNGQPRLTSVTDPLGHEYDYQYDANGQLSTVLKPAVADPNQPASAPLVRPSIGFTYTISTQARLVYKSTGGNPWDSQDLITWVLPSTITDARQATTTFSYVEKIEPSAVQSENGSPVLLWEPKFELSTVQTPDGTAQFTETARDFVSATTKVTDTLGNVTTYQFGSDATSQLVPAYNNLGFAIVIDKIVRSTPVTDADGNTTTASVTYNYSSNINGDLTSVTDVSGNTIQFLYDSGDAGDPFNTQPYGSLYGSRYALFDEPSAQVVNAGSGGLNLTTQYRYDATFNKLVEQVDPDGEVTTYQLDGNGNRIQEVDASGTAAAATTINSYNAQGFVTQTVDPDNRTTTYVPDQYGNLQYTIVKGYAGEDLTPLSSTSPFASQDPGATWLVSERVADVMNNTLSSVDGRGNVTTYTYDNWNRQITETGPAVADSSWNPLGGQPETDVTSTLHQYYDFNSNLVRQSDANGNVTTYTYDAMNRKTQSRQRMTSPTADSGADLVTSQTYDAVGNVHTSTDATSQTTTYKYDALLREIEEDLPPVTEVADPTSTSASPATVSKLYKKKMYYGPNSGSGAFTFAGFSATRIVDARGYATDAVYDGAYRAIRVVKRNDSGAGRASTAAAGTNEPETDTVYNPDGKVERITTRNETAAGAAADRNTYTFYDDRERPTVTVIDMNGNGPGATLGTHVDNAATFAADGQDIVTRSAYDGVGNTVSATDANGNTTHTVYDGAGRPVEKDQPAMTAYLPEGGGQVSGFVPKTYTVYDAAGNAVRFTDADGNKTETTYDARNRAVRTVLDRNADGTFDPTVGSGSPDVVTWTGYDLNGNKTYTIDPNGNRTDDYYDAASRAVRVLSPAVADAENGGASSRPETQTAYDGDGRVIQATDPRGIVTRTQYDEWGRTRFVTANANATAGAADRTVTETRYDADGDQVALVLDNYVSGTLTPQVTSYTFDPFDRQLSQTLPSIGDGHTRTTTRTYDRAGDNLTVTDPMNQATSNKFDANGRLTEQQLTGTTPETRDATYDARGDVLTRSDATGVTTYTYDAEGRETSERRQSSISLSLTGTTLTDDDTILSAYDGDGNRTRVQYPGSGRTLVSRYDAAGRLTSVTDSPTGTSTGTQVTTFGYDSAGNRTAEVQSNGVAETTTFDADNRVLSIAATTPADLNADGVGGDSVYSITYAYDRAGERRSAVELLTGQPERDLTWTYDGEYRLTGQAWTGTDAQSDTNTYDAAGNRLSQSVTVTPPPNFLGPVAATAVTSNTYDALNELTQSATSSGTTTYQYNLDGDRTMSTAPNGDQFQYGYDSSNRMTSAYSNAALVFTAAYDADGNRLAKQEGDLLGSGTKTTTLFRYDGNTNVQQLNGSGQLTEELVRAGGQGGGVGSVLYTDESVAPVPTGGTAGPVERFVYDALGNTVALTNAAGQVTQTTAFDAFGQSIVHTGTSDNNRLRNTKERDFSTGLDDDGQRYYDPATGTYVTRDPSGYPNGLNSYQSVGDDPINHVDPLGLKWYNGWWDAAKAVVGCADPAVQATYDQSVSDRTLGTADAAVTRVTGGLVTSVGGPTFDKANRENANKVGGIIIDTTVTAVQIASGAGAAKALEETGTVVKAAETIEKTAQESEEALTAFSREAETGGTSLATEEPVGGSPGESAPQPSNPEGCGTEPNCFVAGTDVLLGDGQEQSIDTIRVGERVATDGGVANSANGKTEAADRNATAVNPKTWRLVTLEVEAMTATGGTDVMQVQELMPLSTLRAEHAKAGASIPVPLDLGDIGEQGYHATVESVGACPTIEGGSGRVVLTTITHLNDYVFHLTVRDAAGDLETLGVTGFHKLYAEDRGWTSVADLGVGEKLRGDNGDLTVVSLINDPGVARVYNLTVEADHVYYVGELQALSHNTTDCGYTGVRSWGEDGEQLADRAKEIQQSLEGPEKGRAISITRAADKETGEVVDVVTNSSGTQLSEEGQQLLRTGEDGVREIPGVGKARDHAETNGFDFCDKNNYEPMSQGVSPTNGFCNDCGQMIENRTGMNDIVPRAPVPNPVDGSW